MSAQITPALRSPMLEAPAREIGSRDAAEAGRARPEPAPARQQDLDTAVRRAARQMFDDRAVDVRGFHDPVTDRMVYRVVDSDSGRVLFQSPPDELLRFYAMSRGIEDRPLLRVEI